MENWGSCTCETVRAQPGQEQILVKYNPENKVLLNPAHFPDPWEHKLLHWDSKKTKGVCRGFGKPGPQGRESKSWSVGGKKWEKKREKRGGKGEKWEKRREKWGKERKKVGERKKKGRKKWRERKKRSGGKKKKGKFRISFELQCIWN